MNSKWIDIKASDGGRFKGYLSLPPLGKGPGIVLIQEIWGVNRHIRAVADQYALDGFVVLAPDLFWRQAPRVELGYEGAERERGLQLMKASDTARVLADGRSALQALRALPACRGKVGTIGYCLGGRLAYLTAAGGGVDAAVCYYGGGIHDQLDLAAGVACPIQFHYGARDAHIPPAAVQRVREAFAGRAAAIHVYDDADHGFNCWERGSYHPASAALAHGRALQHLAGQLF